MNTVAETKTATSAAMAPAASAPAYDIVYRSLHWSMALFFLTAVGLGIWASYLPPGTSPRRELLEVHKSLGMSILLLAVLRLAYRLRNKPPAYPASFTSLVRLASSSNHWLLYALMLAMPVTGYIYSAAGGFPLRWFWLFNLPRLVALDKETALLGQSIHAWLAWAVYATVAMHIAATAWHSIAKRDGTLQRMLGGK